MFFIENDDVETFLYLTTGGESPYWSVANDSNVLRLGGSPECEDIACKLDSSDAAQIRLLTDDLQEMQCSISLYGHNFKIYLVGRRISCNHWAGFVSVRPMSGMTGTVTDTVAEGGSECRDGLRADFGAVSATLR